MSCTLNVSDHQLFRDILSEWEMATDDPPATLFLGNTPAGQQLWTDVSSLVLSHLSIAGPSWSLTHNAPPSLSLSTCALMLSTPVVVHALRSEKGKPVLPPYHHDGVHLWIDEHTLRTDLTPLLMDAPPDTLVAERRVIDWVSHLLGAIQFVSASPLTAASKWLSSALRTLIQQADPFRWNSVNVSQYVGTDIYPDTALAWRQAISCHMRDTSAGLPIPPPLTPHAGLAIRQMAHVHASLSAPLLARTHPNPIELAQTLVDLLTEDQLSPVPPPAPLVASWMLEAASLPPAAQASGLRLTLTLLGDNPKDHQTATDCWSGSARHTYHHLRLGLPALMALYTDTTVRQAQQIENLDVSHPVWRVLAICPASSEPLHRRIQAILKNYAIICTADRLSMPADVSSALSMFHRDLLGSIAHPSFTS